MGATSVAAIVTRAFVGLILGLFLAAIGFYSGWFTAPPGPSIPALLLLGGAGAGAGLGGFAGWFKPESARSVIAIGLLIALTGGLAGAWGGWELGHAIYPEGLATPGGAFRRPPFIVAIAIATVGSNTLASGFYIFRWWRHREL